MSIDDFLPTDPEFVANPYAFYANLRRSRPAHLVRFDNGLYGWLITCYRHARIALSDPRLSKDPGNAPQDWQEAGRGRPLEDRSGLGTHLLTLDPPDHTRMRAVVSPFFLPRNLKATRNVIEKTVNTLIGQLATAADCDLIAQFAVPLQANVICEILGIPPAHRSDFGRWCDDVVSSSSRGGQARSEALRNLMDYISGLMREKRRHPGDDVISCLLHAEAPGGELDETEIIALIFLLLVAGYETTINLIGNGMLALLQNRDQLTLLRGRPELLESAVEELLRYGSPAEFSTWRFTLKPFQVGETVIPAGQPVLVVLSAANRDPHAFSDPNRLDIQRSDNPHLSFGRGAHYCLGAALARLEGRIAFGALIEQFPDMKLAIHPDQLEWRLSLTIRGPVHLPVALQRSEHSPC
ncbi:cytochrome P450 family protein [Nonomuraea lactucae]|uniref:cytochrome P450 family protein n=1 Tax=Nonomuraea lactucae TaxID=2249762 RepID=UPI000DE3401C|nr:cytochrome P450 [Nonomuraea lactucae]